MDGAALHQTVLRKSRRQAGRGVAVLMGHPGAGTSCRAAARKSSAIYLLALSACLSPLLKRQDLAREAQRIPADPWRV